MYFKIQVQNHQDRKAAMVLPKKIFIKYPKKKKELLKSRYIVFFFFVWCEAKPLKLIRPDKNINRNIFGCCNKHANFH